MVKERRKEGKERKGFEKFISGDSVRVSGGEAPGTFHLGRNRDFGSIAPYHPYQGRSIREIPQST